MSNYTYDELVKRSVIKENYADKMHNELRTRYLIPCDTIDNFYYDTLFYLHLHFSLYLELLNFNVKNNFDITAFSNLWSAINIKFVNTGQSSLTSSITSTGYSITSFSINNKGNGYSIIGASGNAGPLITFVSSSGNTEVVGSTTVEYGLLDIITSGFTVTPASEQTAHDFQIGDTINFTAPVNGTAAVGVIKNIDASRNITQIEITTRGNGYSRSVAPAVTSITVGNTNTARGSTITFATSHVTGYIASASVTNTSKVYRTIGNFVVSSQVGVVTEAKVSPITTIDTIGFINGTEYVFNLAEFNRNYYNTLSYTNAERVNLINNKIPRIEGITYYPNTAGDKPSLFNIPAINSYTRASTNIIQNVVNYNDGRLNNFNNVLKTIFDQDVKDILGFLAYQVRYYNVIVLNTSIQRMIYKYYLNDNSISMSISGIFEPNNAKYANLTNITTHISNMKENLDAIREDVKNVNNIYSESKADYPGKITKLQNNEKDYTKIQDALNNTAKNYNQYYNNYNKLKIYASSIIIFLIILIIATIVITVIPYFNANSKNTYYILILILLIILTVLFYNNFSQVNYYEKFTVVSQSDDIKRFNIFSCTDANKVSYDPNSRNTAQNNAHRQNNYTFFNTISDYLISYNNAYSDLNTQMSSGIYTTDNKAFEQDANNYLNSMYIEKKRKIDLFRIKRTSLTNLIEAIKQQIIYLFNIIFIICLLTIVLLIALLLYVNMPQAMGLIITLVSLAIFFIVIYYIYAVVQPTRLIANKNYWANKNPSQETYNKL